MSQELPITLIYGIFENIHGSNNTLKRAIDENVKPWFLEEVIKNATRFDECLKSAIRKGGVYINQLGGIFEKTVDFDGCLLEALLNKHIKIDFIEDLFEKTNDFDGCLKLAVVRFDIPVEFLDRLLEKNVNVSRCLYEAIRAPRISQDFLERVFERTTIFNYGNDYNCLFAAIAAKRSVEFINKILEKVTNFEGCFSTALCSKYPQPFLEKLLKKVDSACVYELNSMCGYSTEFIRRIFTKSSLTRGWLKFAIKNDFPIAFVEEIFSKESDFRGCLFAAIEKKLPEEFLDKLLTKCGKLNFVVNGYEKYCNIFVENKECFICLLDFEDEEDGIERLRCKHLVHKGCNLQKFKCPYH